MKKVLKALNLSKKPKKTSSHPASGSSSIDNVSLDPSSSTIAAHNQSEGDVARRTSSDEIVAATTTNTEHKLHGRPTADNHSMVPNAATTAAESDSESWNSEPSNRDTTPKPDVTKILNRLQSFVPQPVQFHLFDGPILNDNRAEEELNVPEPASNAAHEATEVDMLANELKDMLQPQPIVQVQDEHEEQNDSSEHRYEEPEADGSECEDLFDDIDISQFKFDNLNPEDNAIIEKVEQFEEIETAKPSTNIETTPVELTETTEIKPFETGSSEGVGEAAKGAFDNQLKSESERNNPEVNDLISFQSPVHSNAESLENVASRHNANSKDDDFNYAGAGDSRGRVHYSSYAKAMKNEALVAEPSSSFEGPIEFGANGSLAKESSSSEFGHFETRTTENNDSSIKSCDSEPASDVNANLPEDFELRRDRSFDQINDRNKGSMLKRTESLTESTVNLLDDTPGMRYNHELIRQHNEHRHSDPLVVVQKALHLIESRRRPSSADIGFHRSSRSSSAQFGQFQKPFHLPSPFQESGSPSSVKPLQFPQHQPKVNGENADEPLNDKEIDDVLRKTGELLNRAADTSPLTSEDEDHVASLAEADAKADATNLMSSTRAATSSESIPSASVKVDIYKNSSSERMMINYPKGGSFHGGGKGKGGSGSRERRSKPRRSLPPRYCDTISPDADPHVIGDIINDLHCVFEKTFGDKHSYHKKYKDIQCDCECLQDELEECEDCRNQLQREVCKLRAELQAAAKALEDEIQRRLTLEQFGSQLKAKLRQLEAIIDSDGREKNALANCLREAEAKLKDLAGIVEFLEIEKDQLERRCRGHEEWRSRESENITVSRGRCDELADALKKCCHNNELLQAENKRLKEDIKNLTAEVEKLRRDKTRLIEELKRERACWSEEKDRFLKMINDLKKAYDDLTAQNQEICQKMNEVVAMHHAELENLRKDVEKYKGFYESERAEREKLDELLRNCEERKARMMKQQVQQQSYFKATNPCDPAFIAQFDAEIMQGSQNSSGNPTSGANENSNAKTVVLEKDLQETKANLNERNTALVKSQQEVEKLKTKQQSLEADMLRDHEELNKLKYDNQVLTANLEHVRNEMVKVREEKQQSIEADLLRDREELYKVKTDNQVLRTNLELTRNELVKVRQENLHLQENQVSSSNNNSQQNLELELLKKESEMKITTLYKENLNQAEGLKQEIRRLKQELKTEREQVYKLRYKSEVMRDQIRNAREQVKELEKDPKSQKLMIELDRVKNSYENEIEQSMKQNEEIAANVLRLQNENNTLKLELTQMGNELKAEQVTRTAIQDLKSRKDRLEKEMLELRKSINEKYVERTEVDRWKETYAATIASLEANYEASFKKQLSAKINEINAHIQRQTRDRSVIEEMRDTNENILRSKYSEVTSSLQSDVESLRKIVNAREEEIATLKTSLTRLRNKYSSEATAKENLLKQVQALASLSQTDLASENENANNNA